MNKTPIELKSIGEVFGTRYWVLVEENIYFFLRNSKKSEIRLNRHSPQKASGARSEALALSSNSSLVWMPDQVRHDKLRHIYETIICQYAKIFKIDADF